MKKFIFAAALAISASFAGTSAQAESALPKGCGQYKSFKKAMDNYHDTHIAFQGLTPDGKFSLTIFASRKTGEWAAITSDTTGAACVRSYGNWFSINENPTGST